MIRMSAAIRHDVSFLFAMYIYVELILCIGVGRAPYSGWDRSRDLCKTVEKLIGEGYIA